MLAPAGGGGPVFGHFSSLRKMGIYNFETHKEFTILKHTLKKVPKPFNSYTKTCFERTRDPKHKTIDTDYFQNAVSRDR